MTQQGEEGDYYGANGAGWCATTADYDSDPESGERARVGTRACSSLRAYAPTPLYAYAYADTHACITTTQKFKLRLFDCAHARFGRVSSMLTPRAPTQDGRTVCVHRQKMGRSTRTKLNGVHRMSLTTIFLLA